MRELSFSSHLALIVLRGRIWITKDWYSQFPTHIDKPEGYHCQWCWKLLRYPTGLRGLCPPHFCPAIGCRPDWIVFFLKQSFVMDDLFSLQWTFLKKKVRDWVVQVVWALPLKEGVAPMPSSRTSASVPLILILQTQLLLLSQQSILAKWDRDQVHRWYTSSH